MERSTARPSSSFKCSRRSPPLTSKFTSRFKSSSGKKQNKRVKFADFDDAPEIHSGPSNKTILNHGTGGAKTSEFMYFKKLSGSSGQKAISKSQNMQAQESGKTRISISDQVEKQMPNGCQHSLSPHKEQLHQYPRLYDTPDQKLRDESTFPTLKITPLGHEQLFLSPEASRNQSADCENGKLMSNKRTNLIKLAAKTLSVGVDDFLLRRSDLIGQLIERLGIKQQPKMKKAISSSHLEASMDKYTHLGHEVKLENLVNHASDLPTLPSIEVGLEPNIRSGWSIQELENSDLYPDSSAGFHDTRTYNSNNYLLPLSPCRDIIAYSFGGGQDKSLVPYACFQSPVNNFQFPVDDFQNAVGKFQNPVDKFNYEVKSWDVKDREQDCSCLPLALYNPANLYDEAEESVGDGFFVSPPRKKVSELELNSSYVCERNNFFSNISDAEYSVANEQSLVLVKETSVNRILGFGCDILHLDPQYFNSGSIWCEYREGRYDPFSIDS